MTIVDDQIAAELLTLAPVLSTPVEPFGYGVDLSCTTELDPDLTEVEATSVQAIAEALFRRLTTANGTLLDDADYGEDVTASLNAGTTVQSLQTFHSKVKGECEKDDRVDSVTVSSSLDTRTRVLTLSIQVVPQDPAVRTFTMTLAVTNGETLLEAIT